MFEDNKYRYLTDIKKFAKPFMARNVTIHPKDCAGGSSYGCGVRWEILGSSKRLGKVGTNFILFYCVQFFLN